MRSLIQELLPHAPQHGLYVAPQLPEDKVRNALGDYAQSVRVEEVVALYDATLLGSAKDGAVFTPDRLVFQNSDLSPAQEVPYAAIVRVDEKRKLLGGRKVDVAVNRGRATVTLTIDFSGRPEAAPFVARFLHEAMIRGAEEEMDRPLTTRGTDVAAVRQALEPLRDDGRLTEGDFERILRLLKETT